MTAYIYIISIIRHLEIKPYSGLLSLVNIKENTIHVIDLLTLKLIKDGNNYLTTKLRCDRLYQRYIYYVYTL